MPSSAPAVVAGAVATSRADAGSDAAAGRSCASCAAALTGPYCAHCGQRELIGRHTVRGMLFVVLERIFSLEQGFVRTAARLTVAPGQTVRDYLRGATCLYTPPAAYILVCFSALVLVSTGFGTGNESDRPFFGIIVLFIAGASRLVFLRAGLNFAEHLILDMFILGHVSLVWGMIILAFRLASALGATPALPLVGVVLLVAGVAYFVWAYGRFFVGRPLIGGLGGFVALALGTGVWGAALAALIQVSQR